MSYSSLPIAKITMRWSTLCTTPAGSNYIINDRCECHSSIPEYLACGAGGCLSAPDVALGRAALHPVDTVVVNGSTFHATKEQDGILTTSRRRPWPSFPRRTHSRYKALITTLSQKLTQSCFWTAWSMRLGLRLKTMLHLMMNPHQNHKYPQNQ